MSKPTTETSSGTEMPRFSIVGFDNYLYPGFPDLKITSYEINTKAMVKVALEKALKQIRGAASGKNMEIVSGQLVPKESVKL